MTNNFVMTALKNACYIQEIVKNSRIIFHSDLCSQYTSNDMKNLCNKFNIKQSFSEKGCTYDRACTKSFQAFLKKEEIYRNIYKNYEDIKKAIFEYYRRFL
ncbi:DDE-type integrase/transposase/recombinase [Clostridium perfringens]|nr:DDE-type integrase/transposase/recombinase [Clostridium perfringens]